MGRRGGYRPRVKWLWDPWFISHADLWHLFHLQADRSWTPEERHDHASIGHAISRDLINWEELPTALEPGPPGGWDDLSIWTGSVLKQQAGRYYLLYTGRRRAQPYEQQIGIATSSD